MKRSLITLIAVCTFSVIIPSYAFSDAVDDYCQQAANQLAPTTSQLVTMLASPGDRHIIDGKKVLCFDPLVSKQPDEETVSTFTISATGVIIYGLNIKANAEVTSNPLVNITGSNVILRNSAVTDSAFTAISVDGSTTGVEIKNSEIFCTTGVSSRGIAISGTSGTAESNDIDGCVDGILLDSTATNNTIGPDNFFNDVIHAINISGVSEGSNNYITQNEFDFFMAHSNKVYTGNNAFTTTLHLVLSKEDGTINIWKEKENSNKIVNKIFGVMPSKGIVELISSNNLRTKCSTIEIASGIHDELKLAAGTFIYVCNDLNLSLSHYVNFLYAKDNSGSYSSGGFSINGPTVDELPEGPIPTTPGPIALSPESVQGGEQQVIIENPGDTSGGDDGFVGMGAAKTCSLTTVNMTNSATASAILTAILTALSPALVMVAIRKRRK